MMANPNDKTRDMILRKFYEIHKNGLGSTLTYVETNINELRKIQTALRIDRSIFYSNLDYLVQKGWILKTHITESLTDRFGFSRSHNHISYRISAEGIDKLEEASAYQCEDMTKKINITNIKGVTIVGSGNIVNIEHTDLSKLIAELENAIAKSSIISEDQKLDLTSDLATIQSQLSKTKPDKSIIQTVWGSIEKTVTVSGFVDFVAKITTLINKVSS